MKEGERKKSLGVSNLLLGYFVLFLRLLFLFLRAGSSCDGCEGSSREGRVGARGAEDERRGVWGGVVSAVVDLEEVVGLVLGSEDWGEDLEGGVDGLAEILADEAGEALLERNSERGGGSGGSGGGGGGGSGGSSSWGVR